MSEAAKNFLLLDGRRSPSVIEINDELARARARLFAPPLARAPSRPAGVKEIDAARAPSLLRKRVKASINKCLRGKGGGAHWLSVLGYSLADLRAHLEAQFVDGMSWENMGAWHIDHIRPLSSFKITGPDCPEFKAAWALSNLQPLWALDNMRKGAKWRPNE